MNKIFLTGRTAAAINLEEMTSNNGPFKTAKGSLYVSRPFGKPNAEGRYPSDLFNLQATGKNAEKLARVEAGKRVAIGGYMTFNQYEKNGVKMYYSSVHVTDVEYIDIPQKKDTTVNTAPTAEATTPPQGMPTDQPKPVNEGTDNFSMPDFDDVMDEELPFL